MRPRRYPTKPDMKSMRKVYKELQHLDVQVGISVYGGAFAAQLVVEARVDLADLLDFRI
jgi:hypothetical protein